MKRYGLTFTRRPDVTLPGRRQWLGCVIRAEEGLRFYGSGRQGVWCAVSQDGFTWKLVKESVGEGADPAVVRTASGRYLMIRTAVGIGSRHSGRERRAPHRR